MADRPIDDAPRGDYPAAMNARVAALEALTQQILVVLQDMRADAREMRAEARSFRTEIIGEIRDLRQHVDTGIAELRRVHDRDCRIAIGLSLGIAVGLAGLIARAVH